MPQAVANTTKTLEQLRAQNAPAKAALQANFKKTQANPAATEVGKPLAPKAPNPAAQMGAVSGVANQGFHTTLPSTDPASVGGAMMQAPTAPAPSAPVPAPAAPAAPDPQAQLKAAQDAYLASFQVSPDAQAVEQQLGGVATQAASDSAKAKLEYADRVKAIEGQATLQPFLTGRETQARGQLNNQLSAIKSASDAQTVPLKERLAKFQATQTAGQQKAQTAEQFAEASVAAQKPVSIGYGATLVNPITGATVAQGEEKPISVGAGAQLIDPATGQVIAATAGKYQSVSPSAGSSSANVSAPKGTGTGGAFTSKDIPNLAAWVAKNNIPASMFPSLLGSGMSGASSALKQQLTKELSTNHPEWNPVGAQSNLGASNVQAKNYNNLVNLQTGAEASLDVIPGLMTGFKLSNSGPIASSQLEYGKLTGNQAVRNYLSVIEDVRSQAAKVLGGGTVTDQSRHQAEQMLPANVSPELMQKNIDSLKALMQNRIDGFAQPTQTQAPGSSTAQTGLQSLPDGSQWQQNPDGSYTKVK